MKFAVKPDDECINQRNKWKTTNIYWLIYILAHETNQKSLLYMIIILIMYEDGFIRLIKTLWRSNEIKDKEHHWKA